MGCGQSHNGDYHVSQISEGVELLQGSMIFSESGLFYLWVDVDGRFHVYQTTKAFSYADEDSTWVWQNTDVGAEENQPYKLVLDDNARLGIWNAKHELVWENGENREKGNGFVLWVENDGNVLIYDKNDFCIWSHYHWHGSLAQDQPLASNNTLFSDNGHWYLWVGEDGLMHLYETSHPYSIEDQYSTWKWSNESESHASGNYTVWCCEKGYLGLYDDKENLIWSNDVDAQDSVGPFYLYVSDTGDLRVYDAEDYCVWSKEFWIEYFPAENYLESGDTLFCEDGSHYLWMGHDGRLHNYKTSEPYESLDATSTWIACYNDTEYENGYYYLYLGEDERLVIYDSNDNEVWNNEWKNDNAEVGSYLYLSNEGKPSVWNASGEEIWG